MDNIIQLQTKIDETKQALAAVDEYATLSGLNMLPQNWIVEPYVFSTQTGIREVKDEHDNVTKFIFDFGIKVKKHYDPARPCYSESNSTLTTQCSLVSGNYKASADWTQEEKAEIGNQSKSDAKIELHALKRAEFDFLDSTLQFILNDEGM